MKSLITRVACTGLLMTAFVAITPTAAHAIAVDCGFDVHDDSFTTQQNTSVEIQSLFNNDTYCGTNVKDPSVDADFAIQESPAHGDLEYDSGTITYVPDTGFVGTDTIDYYLYFQQVAKQDFNAQNAEAPNVGRITITIAAPATTTTAEVLASTVVQTTTTDPAVLAATGANDIAPMAMSGIAMLVSGAGLTAVTRRRRKNR